MRGHCANGAGCSFAHGEHELREVPAGHAGRHEPEQAQQRDGASGSGYGAAAGPSSSTYDYSYTDFAAYNYGAGPAAGVGTSSHWSGAPGGAGPSAAAPSAAGPREMDAGTLAALMHGLELGEEEEEHFAFLCPITQASCCKVLPWHRCGSHRDISGRYEHPPPTCRAPLQCCFGRGSGGGHPMPC
jgi:hypothetical protein